MTTLFVDVLRAVHILAGVLALATFAIPLWVTKGNLVHRRAGWLYVGSMVTGAATAILVAPLRLTERPVEQWGPPIFLAFVGLLSFTSCFHGVAVLGARRRGQAARPVDRAVPALLLGASVALLGYAVWSRFLLAGLFVPLGLLVAVPQLRAAAGPPPSPNAALVAHLTSMIIAVIGTLTAFLVTNARVFGGLGNHPLVWLFPTLVGVPLMRVFARRYRKDVAAV